MKNKVMILAAAITLVACGGNQQKKAVSEKVKADAVKVDMHDAESSLDYQGTYTGVFPAADCPGIDMRLTLKKDGTYSLHMKYLDRDSEFDEKGAYKVKGNLHCPPWTGSRSTTRRRRTRCASSMPTNNPSRGRWPKITY